MAIAPLSASALDSPTDAEGALGLADPFAGSVGALAGLDGGAAEAGDPGAMSANAIDQIFALGGVDLGGIKAALGAVTGDPMAIAAGLEPGIAELAKGQDLFAGS